MEPLSHPLSRRRALRLVAGGLLAIPAGLRLAGDAAAGWTWCRTDPVVKIDGKTADVYLYSDRALHDAALGPAVLVLAVPPDVPAELLAMDQGFGGWGYDVSFEADDKLDQGKGGPQVRVEAYVPSADGALPLKLHFAPRSSGLDAASDTGSVNEWIRVQTR